MTRTHLKIVSIAAGRDPSRLSKGQKTFNTLIKQIERKRARLAAWEEVIAPYQRKYASELVPLIDDLEDLEVEMVYCLDRASDWKGLTKTERRKIAGVITELAGELVASRDDAALKAIYNKHSRSDYDAEQAADIESMKSMLEDALGIELGDDLDASSPDDVLKHAQAKMREMRSQDDADRDAQEERQGKRRKSAKQIAREAKQQAEAQQLSQSIREIYRKLASALHPDRESDPLERERKTVLMQRANQAYGKNNLLQLLELQLELEHIDQSAINNISEDRLKHYNKILKEQLVELEHEILRVEGGFQAQFGISPLVDLSPATIMRELAVEIVGIQRAIRDSKRDLHAFEDIKTFKTWLKTVQPERRTTDIDDIPF